MTANLEELIATIDPDRLADIIASLPPAAAAALLDDPALTAATLPPPATLLELGDRLIPGFRRRPHIEYLAHEVSEAVARVEAGQSQYLIVEMPPRAGKSTIVTQLAPAWILQKHPEWPIALTSHDSELSTAWGRQIRRWVEDGELPGVDVARDAGAVKSWQTTAGGSMRSISTRESFTGRGAKVLIIDDPHKDFTDSHSLKKREEVWRWWQSTSASRLQPPALVVVVQTRWHEDDLVGRLLNPALDGDPAQWKRIRFPAIAEAGDALDRPVGAPLISPLVEEDHDEALQRWAGVRQTVGAYIWSAMYQQNPSPPDGRIVQRDWIQYYDTPPGSFEQIIQSWDLAFGDSDNSSYVVGQVWGKQGADRYLLDQFRERTDFVGTLRAIEQMSAKWPDATLKLIEKKANGAAVLSALRRKISGLKPVDPAGSKLERLYAVTPYLEAGNVHLPAAATWTRDLVEELASFPSGAHDDQVDALTQALQRLSADRRRPRARVSVY